MGLGPPILELKQGLRPPIVGWRIFPKNPLGEQILGVKIWNLVPIFSKLVNFGPHISASLEGTREGLQDAQILWAKVQKQKSYEGSNFEDDFDFLEIGGLWSTYFDVFGKPSGRATSHQNSVGQSSETKKLLGDQILNYGPNFLEIGEFWSTYFGTVGNSSRSTTRPPNIVGQSSKTTKLCVKNPKIMVLWHFGGS